MNAGALKEPYLSNFKSLFELCEQNKHLNQWKLT